MTAMNNADERWLGQNGNNSACHREVGGQAQRAQFQGVVVPINGVPARNNGAFHTGHQVPPTFIPSNVHSIGSSVSSASQTAPQNVTYSNGVSHVQHNAFNPQGPIERQTNAAPPLDYQLLLFSLAEDYFAAAYKEGSMVALYRRETELKKYYKLVATGLGCLEAVLKVSGKVLLVY